MTPSKEDKFALSTLLNNSDRHIDVAVEHQRMSLQLANSRTRLSQCNPILHFGKKPHSDQDLGSLSRSLRLSVCQKDSSSIRTVRRHLQQRKRSKLMLSASASVAAVRLDLSTRSCLGTTKNTVPHTNRAMSLQSRLAPGIKGGHVGIRQCSLWCH